ncbi:hypothetical protein BJX76DRAFT_70384 [Aspergillus varians]
MPLWSRARARLAGYLRQAMELWLASSGVESRLLDLEGSGMKKIPRSTEYRRQARDEICLAHPVPTGQRDASSGDSTFGLPPNWHCESVMIIVMIIVTDPGVRTAAGPPPSDIPVPDFHAEPQS